MKRNIIYEMIEWKTSNKDKLNNTPPLVLAGLKSIGKTYLAYDFARIFFNYIYYFNFELKPADAKIFTDNNLSHSILSVNEYPEDDYPKNRVLILDEIQYLDDYYKVLSKLYTEKEFPYIIIISSNETFAQSINFNKNYIKVAPLFFDEFLNAIGQDWYVDAIINHFNTNKKLPEIVHNELLDLHSIYIKVGGFPQAINEYLNFAATINVSSIHKTINNQLLNYLSIDEKVINDNEVLKVNQIYNGTIKQLIKENKKFQYNIIRKGTTQNYFSKAIEYLTSNGYLLISEKIDSNGFKLYYSDVGILNTELTSSKELDDLDKSIYEKAIMENYIGQVLQNNGHKLLFWESDSIAKIDFIIKNHKDYIPIEVFTGNYTRTKSVSIFKKEYKVPYSIKISTNNFSYKNGVKNIPIYAAFCI